MNARVILAMFCIFIAIVVGTTVAKAVGEATQSYTDQVCSVQATETC